MWATKFKIWSICAPYFLVASLSTMSTVALSLPNIEVIGNNFQLESDPTNLALVGGSVFPFTLIGESRTHTFQIRNTGSTTLTLTGAVTITGSAPGDFAIVTQPATSIAAGQYTTLSVRFSPPGPGLGGRNAVITITSNDSDQSSFAFRVLGIAATQIPDDVKDLSLIHI